MKKRVVTGDRPTGRLHLGHYVGSLQNRLELQENGEELFVFIADLHSLTTYPEKEKTSKIGGYSRQILRDYLSVGLLPEKTTFYRQSHIEAIPYLATLFSMLVTVPRLERMPALKEVMRDLKIQSATYGLLGYPVLMASDILAPLGTHVPVGEDQKSHVELAREIARNFNREYGELFPEPKEVLSELSRLPGIDGEKKMSKSLGNAIYLSDSDKEVREKVMKMFTDPSRVHGDEPGNVEGNPVFTYLDNFSQKKDEVDKLKSRYKEGNVKDVEVKEFLSTELLEFLSPIKEKSEQYSDSELEDIFISGEKKAKEVCDRTLGKARELMGL